MKYRSRTDIVSQILEAANDGATRAKIMYKAFLSYVQLKDYISILVENGLLEYDQKTQTYKTTSKGNKVIKVYKSLGEFVTPEQETKELARA